MGDTVPRNGMEDQAAHRTRLREQAMARQAAERKAQRPAIGAKHAATESLPEAAITTIPYRPYGYAPGSNRAG